MFLWDFLVLLTSGDVFCFFCLTSSANPSIQRFLLGVLFSFKYLDPQGLLFKHWYKQLVLFRKQIEGVLVLQRASNWFCLRYPAIHLVLLTKFA